MRTLPVILLAIACLAPLAEAKGSTVTIHAGTNADGSLYFQPKDIHVAEGDRVTITLVNDDPSTPHDWALLEYAGHDIEVYVKGGETRTINFTASETGTFRIVCQVVGHKQKGMEGSFVVDDKLLVSGAPPALAAALVALAAITLRKVSHG